MTERPRPTPTEGERAPEPLPKTADERYEDRGFWQSDGCCRIRVFAAPGRTPVIVATELPDNPGTSITNIVEYLAPELIAKHFPHRFEEAEPCVWIEHDPAPEPGHYGLRRNKDKPDHNRVTFASWTPRADYLHGIKRARLPEPTWRHLSYHEVAQLIGEGELDSEARRT